MSEQTGFFARIGSWFKGGPSPDADHPSPPHDAPDNGHTSEGDSTTGAAQAMVHAVEATRGSTTGTFLRPWAKRDAAIGQLQEGFTALTGLMGAIRDSLDKQSQRQDQLLDVLSNLPNVLRSIPESGAAQTETLRAIAEQIKYQNAQQAQLGEILQKVAETGGDQREMLDGLRERVENLGEQDDKIADSLHSVGSAMQTVSRTAATSAQVLEQMRDNTHARESELQRLLERQGARHTVMLVIAILLAVLALAAVCAVGYLVLYKPH